MTSKYPLEQKINLCTLIIILNSPHIFFTPPVSRSKKADFLSDLASKIGAGPPKKPVGLVKKPEVSAADAAAANEAAAGAASDDAVAARAKMADIIAAAAKVKAEN